MDLNQLFEPQKELDTRIRIERDLEGENLFLKKTNALNCELWECLNESRVFKFWSSKRPDRNKLLEEYADCIHFLISISNDLGYTKHEYHEPNIMDLNLLANGLSNMVTLIPYTGEIEKPFNYFIKLGYQLGFDEEDVIWAYMDKNKTNHDRQESGTY